jgi:hypothetical protein
MKVSILSIGSFALSFLSCSLVHSFPTAENFAKLTHRNGLSSEDIHENLLRLKQKRLFFDPMTTPIDGMCCRQDIVLISLIPSSDWKTRFQGPKL